MWPWVSKPTCTLLLPKKFCQENVNSSSKVWNLTNSFCHSDQRAHCWHIAGAQQMVMKLMGRQSYTRQLLWTVIWNWDRAKKTSVRCRFLQVRSATQSHLWHWPPTSASVRWMDHHPLQKDILKISCGHSPELQGSNVCSGHLYLILECVRSRFVSGSNPASC